MTQCRLSSPLENPAERSLFGLPPQAEPHLPRNQLAALKSESNKERAFSKQHAATTNLITFLLL